MDLESECSAHESVEDNEVITPQRSENLDEIKVENNGSHVGEHNKQVDDDKDVGVMETVVNSPQLSVIRSPSGSVGSSPPAAMKKGFGLKKWKRIKRNSNKDDGSQVDTSKILKRGLPNSVANSSRPHNSSVDIRQKSGGSVSSTNATVRSPGVAIDGFSIDGSNLDPRLENGPTDSENSEDWSSKSSTAASVPKLSYEIPMMMGYSSDKNKMRSPSGKNLGNSAPRGQHGKGRVEASKKPRGGERVKIEKENSHSSMESDSRSSNFVFLQGANSITSNGRQRTKSANYDGESDDEALDGEQRFSEELRTAYGEENVGEYEEISQEDINADLSWEAKQGKSENSRPSSDPNPLIVSILSLQSAQEALEKELEKFRETGKEQISHFDGSTQTSYSPMDFASVNTNISEGNSLETQVISLKQSVSLLESKLEEATARLKVKEAEIVELETGLETRRSPDKETESERFREMEAELEGIFKQKIEAEVEYLAISGTTQNLRAAVVDRNTVLEEQKALVSAVVDRNTVLEEQKALVLEQAQILNQLGDAERKAMFLEREAEKLETYCADIVETDEVLKLQNRVLKITSCFFIQLILLVVVFVLFVMQLSPHYTGVVPT